MPLCVCVCVCVCVCACVCAWLFDSCTRSPFLAAQDPICVPISLCFQFSARVIFQTLNNFMPAFPEYLKKIQPVTHADWSFPFSSKSTGLTRRIGFFQLFCLCSLSLASQEKFVFSGTEVHWSVICLQGKFCHLKPGKQKRFSLC